MKTIKKAVIPVAGLGSRFLPATKAVPKEMLPVFDRPVIELILRELSLSGVKEVIFVIPPAGSITPGHFAADPSLESELRKKGKDSYADMIREIADLVRVTTVIQERPLGDGHAILQAEQVVDGDDFFVFFGDELLFSDLTAPEQLLQAKGEKDACVLGVQRVPQSDIHKFGIIDIGTKLDESSFTINGFVEKPQPQDAPSDLALLGKNLCTARIFDAIRRAKPGNGGELRLVDAFEILLQTEEIIGRELSGERFDVGNPAGLLAASNFVAARQA